jgi:uncharacterized membrane protein
MKDNNIWMWIIAAVAVLFLIFLGVGSANNYNMMGMVYGNYGYGMMFFGWITWIVIVILMIAAIYWLIKSANKK